MRKFQKIRSAHYASSWSSQSIPSALTLLLSLLSILEDRKVLTWISASMLSRHRHTKAFAVSRGMGMSGWNTSELFMELRCRGKVSWMSQIGEDERLGHCIILSRWHYFPSMAFSSKFSHSAKHEVPVKSLQFQVFPCYFHGYMSA